MEKVSFLHIANFAEEGPWAAWRPRLTPSQYAQLRKDWLQALAAAAELARRENVDAIFCTGGLWNDAEITAQDAAAAFDILGSMAPRPVFLVPGEQDPFHRFSYGLTTFYKEETGRPHPENLHVFGKAGAVWEPRETPRLPGVEIWGRAVTVPGGAGAASSGGETSDAGSNLRISLSGQSAQSAEAATPLPELRSNSRFPAAVGTVDANGFRSDLRTFSLEFRHILPVDVACEATTWDRESLARRIAKGVESAGATPNDLVSVSVSGEISPEELVALDVAGIVPQQEAYFGVLVSFSGLHVAWPSRESLPQEAGNVGSRVEQAFLRRLARRSAAGGPEEKTVVEALRLGLGALKGHRVDVTSGL